MTRATMPAAVLAGAGRLEIAERPVPALDGAPDVLLDVEACGICGTDLQILGGGHPATVGVVLGHEFVGRVAEVGPGVDELPPGRRVAVAPNVSCGQCEWCRRGLRNQCERFTTHGVFVDGGLAPHVRVPASACHPVSESLPAHVAALVEPLSTVVHGARQARPFPGETALVVGAGPIGLMFVALFRLAGLRVGVVERSDERRRLAEALGAEDLR
ncbi:MAG: alcohol dehydrogenase catalytic domain-containing protein, partial [Actinomycetota bacterium]|nr:alcohol dehydrogenase catalytic domain-containing protein [Actinomycetota bacterium]